MKLPLEGDAKAFRNGHEIMRSTIPILVLKKTTIRKKEKHIKDTMIRDQIAKSKGVVEDKG